MTFGSPCRKNKGKIVVKTLDLHLHDKGIPLIIKDTNRISEINK